MHLSPGVYNDGNLKVGGRWYFSLGSLYHCQLVLWYVIYKHCEAFRELLSGIFSGVTIMFLNWYKLLSLIIACATSLQQWHVKGSFYNTSFMRSVILFLGGLLFLVWGGGGLKCACKSRWGCEHPAFCFSYFTWNFYHLLPICCMNIEMWFFELQLQINDQRFEDAEEMDSDSKNGHHHP